MSHVLIVAEQAGGQLKKANAQAIAAGREIASRTGGNLLVVLLGKGVTALAADLASFGEEVRVADAPELEHYLAEAYAPVVANLVAAERATYVGAAASAFGKDLLPRVAARLDAAMASDVLGFGGTGPAVTFRRPMWAGNVLAEVELTTPVKAFSIRTTEFAPAVRKGQGKVTAIAVAVDLARLPTRFVELREVKSNRPELTEARVVIAGGRGVKGDFKVIEELADALGGAVGATRAAVDAGWVANDLQIGQTGKVVAPDLYIAAGISGSIQHTAGVKGSKVIVAVNKDADAPILQIADYALVADLFQVLPALCQKVKAGK